MTPTPKLVARMVCPNKRGKIIGTPMWKAMAFPFHLKDRNCKKCGKSAVEHGLVLEPMTDKEIYEACRREAKRRGEK